MAKSMKSPKVVVVMSTYNREELLTRSLNSLFKSFDKIKPYSIVVCDDCSTDGTWEYLTEEARSEVQTLQTHNNSGLRSVLNFLLDFSYKLKPDYICYVQDDVEFEKGWLDKCVEMWKDPNWTHPDVVWRDSKGNNLTCSFGFITGHDAPEHPVRYDNVGNYLLKDSCRATHLFASTERWKEFGEIPDLTPGIATPKSGHGSLVDWWLVGHPGGKYPESKASLKNKGEKVLCIPGLIKHIGKEDSTWNSMTFEREKLIPNRIGVQIITRNRPASLACLLTSLRQQTVQDFDLFIVDNSDTPVTDNQIINMMLTRLELEGHRITIARQGERDIPFLRNVALDMDNCEFGVRIDDDNILESDYLELLRYVIMKEPKVGAVSGINPMFYGERTYSPVPKIFNQTSEFFDTFVDIWNFYNVDKFDYFPAHHLSSTFMYRNEIAKKIRHTEGYGKTGYREETDFSMRFLAHGYKNFVIPNAISWHLPISHGGGREAYTGLENATSRLRWNNDQMYKKHMKEIFNGK